MAMMWRIIEYAPNYIINEYGEVYKYKGEKCYRIMKTSIDRYGYLKMPLSYKGKRYYKTVHRLVAEIFIPNPDNLPEVNHIDGNKLNNHISNLEWCTGEYNLWHSINVLGNDNKNIDQSYHAKTCNLYIDDCLIKSFESISAACEYAKKHYNIPYTQLQKHYVSRNARLELI